ncbi:MAG: hypothetical protein V1845_02465 [bacterium]
MTKKSTKIYIYVLIILTFFGAIILGLNTVSLVLAQNADTSGVSFPVRELGNCANNEECKAYCDEAAHQNACLDFAEKSGLMEKEEVDKAKKVLKLTEQGVGTPGGCRSENECDAYCSDTAHLDECITFGEKAGILSAAEIKMIKATGGKGPGGCKGKDACDAYCEKEKNLDECINFAEQNGMMTSDEKEMIKKTGGKGPGGCKGKDACDAYCTNGDHFDECVEFGRQYGMMSEEEYQMAKKMGPKMMQGGPGGCKGKEECDKFCNDEKNFETCIDFGHDNGMMSDEEYQMAKKMGSKMMQGGPGGCKGKEECEKYCNNPGNAETCMNFAVESGMMTQEELDKMKAGGFMMPPKDALGPNGEFAGPGGCKTQEECMAFCSAEENKNICTVFGAGPQGPNGPQGTIGAQGENQQGQLGPGGCDSPTACMKFCSESANQQTCMNFSPSPPPAGQGTPVPRIEPGQQQAPMPGTAPEGGGMAPPPGTAPPPPAGQQPPPPGTYPDGMMPPGGVQPPQGMMPQAPPSEFIPPPSGGTLPPPSGEAPPPPPPSGSLVMRALNSFADMIVAAFNVLVK